MKTIAYVGNFGFPDKNAAGKRVLGNCKLLQSLGYRTICIGPGAKQPCECNGIMLYSIPTGNPIRRVLKSKIKDVEAILKQEKVDIVILYGALFTQKANFRLLSWCKRKALRVFYDQVDWLDINWHNPFRGLIRTWNYYLLNKKVIPACDGVICISSYLADYYSRITKKTIVIPPLSIEKIDCLPEEYHASNTIRFVYAGTTSDVNRPTSQWKDRIDIMFEKLLECTKNPSLRPFTIDIYGMTEEQYIGMFPKQEKISGRRVLEELGSRVSFHGTLSNEEVLQKIRLADFTILIRDKKRATMAGFPTKVSESISCGTPVLCNDTSDIRMYITQGTTGFLSDDILGVLSIVLRLSNSGIIKMKAACLDSPFHYEKYKDLLGRFLAEQQIPIIT